MRVRLTRGLLSIVILLVPSVAFVAPASADPNWQSVTLTPRFHCTVVDWAAIFPGVFTGTCIVVNGNATQSVAIVENRSGGPISIEAPSVRLWRSGVLHYDRHCLPSTLNHNFVRACFAPTIQRPCETFVQAQSTIVINGVADPRRFSPTWEMCT
jgi:hypothetical protein